jgi:hypothetical protein
VIEAALDEVGHRTPFEPGTRRAHPDQVGAGRQASLWVAGPLDQPSAHAAADAVAHHRWTHLAWDGERDPRRARRRIGQVDHRDRVGSGASTGATQCEERSPVTDPPDQAERR